MKSSVAKHYGRKRAKQSGLISNGRSQTYRYFTVLRPVYTCDFSCDFDAILRTKPAPGYPTLVFSRVTLRHNTAKLAEIGKRGCLQIICDTFLSNPCDALRKKAFVQGRVRSVLYAKSHQKSRVCKRALRNMNWQWISTELCGYSCGEFHLQIKNKESGEKEAQVHELNKTGEELQERTEDVQEREIIADKIADMNLKWSQTKSMLDSTAENDGSEPYDDGSADCCLGRLLRKRLIAWKYI